ncbi:MAG: penicillin-binding protein 2 [Gammaproteobacteria bacterium]|nr:penicillin-binding protein 2 [Gammaproteobacteria bacterium]
MTGEAEIRSYPGRRHTVLVVFLAVAGLLLWRGLDLTLTRKDFLQHQGDARFLRVVDVPAHRGMILDRHGEPLAASTPIDSVWANPGELAGARDRWPDLAQILDLHTEQIHRLIATRIGREFVYLKRHVAPELADRVQAMKIPGVALQREYRRYYPAAEVAAHVVGFTNVDDVGQEGIELVYNQWLQGTSGSKRVIRDRLGRVVEDVENIRTSQPGKDLTLSLDRRVQHLAYRELKMAVKKHRAKSGSVVVLDAGSGEVLAMVNQPAYNPNNRTDRIGERFRNRAVTDVFEPGSTVKPFTIAAALETGRFQPGTSVDTTPGLVKVGRHTIRDPRNYGVIDVSAVIMKSSNVGAAKIALALSRQNLWQLFDKVGFGAETGSEFPGESTGILTDFGSWGEVHRATLSFGYGLSVTALQLARAYSVIAADGILRPASFMRIDQPEEGERVFSSRTAWQVRRMLENVLGQGGTGTRGRVAGYRVAGKTGTVRKSTVGGYATDRYMAVFAGMAPASRPEVVIAVVINEPGGKEYYGGQVAAPLFSQVMAGTLRILGIIPDDLKGINRRIAMEAPVTGARVFDFGRGL